MIKLPVQPNLFSSFCATECELWNKCGGSPSAPCRCIQPKKDCENCPFICMEREVEGFDLKATIKEGLALEKVQIQQGSLNELSSFIPLDTHLSKSPISTSSIAVDIEYLLTKPTKRASKPKKYLTSVESVRSFLNANNNTNLIAILNGFDSRLATFWGMGEVKRRLFFKQLKACGFSLCTAPTFSITAEETGFPASHNVLMQRQHHQVLAELNQEGLIAVPNLYCRDERDIETWANWINKQINIKYLSRDFSLSKTNPQEFRFFLSQLIEILKLINIKPHIFLVGVADGFGIDALRQLRAVGCTGSIISSKPIITAIKGEKLEVKNNKLKGEKDESFSHAELIEHNIEITKNHVDATIHNFV